MRGAAALWIASLVLFGCVSPSDPWSHAESLKMSQRRYTQAIRWGDLAKAASYVDPEQRDAFLALAGSFENVRITDVEVGELDIDEEGLASASVDVTYRGYVLSEFVEKRVDEQQEWYRGEGAGNDWRVRPQLAAILDEMGARR